jgi:hypothetical protein
MTKKSAPKPPDDDPEEYKRFLEMARELEVDDTEEAAERAFKKVVIPKSPSKDGGV